MSFFSELQDFTFGKGISQSDFMWAGSMYTFGGDVAGIGPGSLTMTDPAMGTHAFDYRSGTTTYTKSVATSMSGWQKVGLGVGMAGTIGYAGIEAYNNGPRAGALALVQDIAIGGALANYAYSFSEAAGGPVMGRFGGGSIYEALRSGSRSGYAIRARAMGFGSFAGRGIAGMAAMGAVQSVFGDSVAGFMLTPAAAALGTRASPYLWAGTAVVGGAYMAGKGAYSVLKAGYDYRQSQKSIQTSGDLMAFNTQSALTMRSRAVQAMQNSHMNARSALGQEASFLHHPSRSYHAPWRAGY